jgi:hypothetical protein
MATFAPIQIAKEADGIVYSQGELMPAAEADLVTVLGPPSQSPIVVPYHAAIVAAVELSITPGYSTNSTYVVLQSDLGDGNWFDLAWCVWTGVTTSANFLLSAGVGGANAFQQSRAVGTAPSGSGSNQCPLGGRVRFVGKSALTGTPASSSGSSGLLQNGAFCNIVYRILGLR